LKDVTAHNFYVHIRIQMYYDLVRLAQKLQGTGWNTLDKM